MKRTIFVVGLVLLSALAFAVPALAGGWAVITLDELPGPVKANQPLEIGFMIRQHGVTPLGDLSPIINAHIDGSTQTVRVLAEDKGETGHYAATLVLPQSGTWQWEIEAFGAAQPMPALTVVNASAAEGNPSLLKPNTLALLIGGVGVLILGGILTLQKKVRWAVSLVVVGLLVSGVGFASAASQPGTEAQTKKSAALPAASQVELGRDLFIAKGCMLCHAHNETNGMREFGTDIGPNLTNFSASAEYLRLWLKNPSAVKSTTKMPTLGLSDSEIEALIAFINDK
jgi:cytochrome c2